MAKLAPCRNTVYLLKTCHPHKYFRRNVAASTTQYQYDVYLEVLVNIFNDELQSIHTNLRTKIIIGCPWYRADPVCYYEIIIERIQGVILFEQNDMWMREQRNLSDNKVYPGDSGAPFPTNWRDTEETCTTG